MALCRELTKDMSRFVAIGEIRQSLITSDHPVAVVLVIGGASRKLTARWHTLGTGLACALHGQYQLEDRPAYQRTLHITSTGASTG